MQPQLKTAGFDMKIKNTTIDNLFGEMSVGQLRRRRCSASS